MTHASRKIMRCGEEGGREGSGKGLKKKRKKEGKGERRDNSTFRAENESDVACIHVHVLHPFLLPGNQHGGV